MATIAQLTDLHLLEDDFEKRPLAGRARLSYLSFGRQLDPKDRRARVAKALRDVRESNVDHLLLTGDLTEDGTLGQFEVLAELLAESRLAPERITIVPGNHDSYDDGQNFARAMNGPLRAFAESSQTGVPLACNDVTLVPVSTAFHQSCLRSAGSIAKDELHQLGRLTVDPAFRDRPLVFAQHHPPGRNYIPILQWIDGFVDHAQLMSLFEQAPHLYVVHGHTHRAVNRVVKKGDTARIFSAKAVVESDSPLRLYDASPAGLSPMTFDLLEGAGELALPA